MTKLLPISVLAFLLAPSNISINPAYIETGYGVVELEIESTATIDTVLIGDCDTLDVDGFTYNLWIAITEGSPSTVLPITAVDNAGTSSQAIINYDSSLPQNPSGGGSVDLIYIPPANCFKTNVYMPVVLN